MESDEIPTVLLTIAYDSGMDERIMETLQERGVPGWTKTFDAHGAGGAEPKLNSPVFPGSVFLLYIVLPEADAPRIAEALRALQKTYRRNPGLTMWTTPACLL
ncbi:MAG: hypothetical protein JWL77_5966 [Chthonomonadaceae bacterium]|nr:hypothetical protein [Chthonomonadaceae bacterium]